MTDLRQAAETLQLEVVKLKKMLEQQQAEPTCPDCKAAVLYECVACSNNNYPPKQQAEPVADEAIHAAWSAGYVEGEKAALEQPVQEPYPEGDVVGPCICGSWPGGKCLKCPRTPQQQAEPVAYLCENAVGHKYFRWKKPSSTYKPIALYTTPPQRPWVGLTVTTILNMMPSAIPAEYDGPLMEFARAVEAKLKERNK